MNALHLSSEKTWRGGEQQLAYLIEELEKKGINQVVAVRKHSAFEDYCKKKNWKYYSLPFAGQFDLATAKHIKRICRWEKIDITHAHSSRSHALAIWATVLGNKVPLILARRVDFPVNNNGLSGYKYNHPIISKIICVSDAIKTIMAPAIKDKSKLLTIYDGIDLTRFGLTPDPSPASPAFQAPSPKERESGYNLFERGTDTHNVLRKEFNIGDDELLIGNVAALAPHKDYFTFLNTAKILSAKIKARFIIIGEGELREVIEERIDQLGLQKKVILTGFRNDLETIFPELDIFLFTSETEGLGSSILDAMVCGVPVVATMAGGVPEIIEHEKTGLLAPVKDVITLADNVLRLTNDTALRSTIIQQAKERVKQFSKEVMAEKTLEIYKGL